MEAKLSGEDLVQYDIDYVEAQKLTMKKKKEEYDIQQIFRVRKQKKQ